MHSGASYAWREVSWEAGVWGACVWPLKPTPFGPDTCWGEASSGLRPPRPAPCSHRCPCPPRALHSPSVTPWTHPTLILLAVATASKDPPDLPPVILSWCDSRWGMWAGLTHFGPMGCGRSDDIASEVRSQNGCGSISVLPSLPCLVPLSAVWVWGFTSGGPGALGVRDSLFPGVLGPSTAGVSQETLGGREVPLRPVCREEVAGHPGRAVCAPMANACALEFQAP